MNIQDENAILVELKVIKKLLALSLIKGESSEGEQVIMLHRYGFQPKEVSDLLQINHHTVKSILFRAKKSKGKKSKTKVKP
jgi:DNA-directed RNA polymerase specialized sigma24 family protein